MISESWRILLVDDDEDDFFLTRALLSRIRPGRFTLDWAQNYASGKLALQNSVYDAVLVDYYLGTETGIDLVREAIADNYPAPILVLTGQGRPDLDMEALQAGASDYLSKQEMTTALLDRSIRFAIERKQNERSLKEANIRLSEELEGRKRIEGRLRRLLETSYEGIWIINLHGIIEYVNPRGAEILGYQVDEVFGRSAFGFLFSADHVGSAIETLKHITEGYSGHAEAHTRHKDGREIILLVSTGPIVSETGDLQGALAMFTDITERRHAENHARFLADLGNHLIEDRDPAEITRLVTTRISSYLEAKRCSINEGEPIFTPKLPLGQTLVVENSATDPRTAGITMAGLLAGAISFILIPYRMDDHPVAGLLVVKDHAYRWTQDEVALTESVAHLTWLALNHARSSRSLRQAEERFRVALDSTQMTVFTMDRNLRYTWIHNPPPDVWPKDCIGKRDDDILPVEIANLLIEPKREIIERGQPLSLEVTLPLAGSARTYNLTMEPLRDEKGAVNGLIAAALDITHLRSLEAQQIEHSARAEVQRLLNQQREMERLQMARDLHDGPLQELMAASIGLADAMRIQEPDARQKKMEWVREILHRQAAEIRVFCQELRPPILDAFGLEKAIRSYLIPFQERHPGIRFRLDLTPDRKTLPEETRMAFFRIFQEALNNVVRHAHASEIRISLWVGTADVTLEIADNGEGFQVPEDWVTQARTNHFGLLGMHERAAAVNAELNIFSAPGLGTRICVSVAV